jgi:hypothetical protein
MTTKPATITKPTATRQTFTPAVILGHLFPPREQRPGQPPVYAVGRLRREDGTRGLLIHVVETAHATLEVRHRLSEPDGDFVIVGTLRNGTGWLDLRADDPLDPWEAWCALQKRRHHEGWKIYQADRSRTATAMREGARGTAGVS